MYRKDDYFTNQHSCFLLQYHLVLIAKYRHKVIIGKVKDDLMQYTRNYFKEQELILDEINSDEDHIHILFTAYPNMNLAKFVNAYKSASARYIRKENTEFLGKYYWKPYFWSSSYFICTVSDRSEAVIRQYIKNQGNKK